MAYYLEQYYVALPPPESIIWHHTIVWSILFQQKQCSNYLCFYCVTIHEATMQNNQQKEASGDTDGSISCLREKNRITSFALKLL